MDFTVTNFATFYVYSVLVVYSKMNSVSKLVGQMMTLNLSRLAIPVTLYVSLKLTSICGAFVEHLLLCC